MIVWMRRHARDLKGDLRERRRERAARRARRSASSSMAFLAVLREGFETAVFLLAAFQQSTSPAHRHRRAARHPRRRRARLPHLPRRRALNLRRFFRVTGVVLVLVAAGLLSTAVHTAHEAGWFNCSPGRRRVDLTWLIEPGSVQLRAPHRHVRDPAGADRRRAARLPALRDPDDDLSSLRPQRSGRRRRPPSASACRPPCSAREQRSRWSRSAWRPSCAVGGLRRERLVAATGGAASKARTIEGHDQRRRLPAARPSTTKAGPDHVQGHNDGRRRGQRVRGPLRQLASSARSRTSRRGLNGEFSLTLKPGTYTTYCPGGERSGQARGHAGTAATKLSAAGAAAVGSYRAYLEAQTAQLVTATKAFTATPSTAGDVDAASSSTPRRASPTSAIEPVAETFGDLDPPIDAREGDVPDEQWTGFHQIEQTLWVRGTTAGSATRRRG